MKEHLTIEVDQAIPNTMGKYRIYKDEVMVVSPSCVRQQFALNDILRICNCFFVNR